MLIKQLPLKKPLVQVKIKAKKPVPKPSQSKLLASASNLTTLKPSSKPSAASLPAKPLIVKKRPRPPILPLPSTNLPEEFDGTPLHSHSHQKNLTFEIDWDKVTSIHDIKAILSTLDLRYNEGAIALLKIGYLVKQSSR